MRARLYSKKNTFLTGKDTRRRQNETFDF